MKVTIVFGEEIDPLIQAHLDGDSIPVARRVRQAVAMFNDYREKEKTGKLSIGWGDSSRFRQYNTESPSEKYLEVL